MEAKGGLQRWLLLVHQLPSKPSKLRVKVWRRLQAVGAVLVKNSVYVLPNSSETREDFEWIRGEIAAQGGDAMVFTADTVDEMTTDEVTGAFVAARREDWEELRERAGEIAARAESSAGDSAAANEPLAREVAGLRNRAAQIDKIDFFGAPGRDEALLSIEELAPMLGPEPDAAPSIPTRSAADFDDRRWLTRPRPGVDRMASAWLIRRFVDPGAAFEFADEVPPRRKVVPFDMFGVEFGHHGNRCTFETLIEAFGIDEPPIRRIARIVHDLDLRRDAATEPETATVGRIVEGLRAAFDQDLALLEQGASVFEALYRSFRGESSGA